MVPGDALLCEWDFQFFLHQSLLGPRSPIETRCEKNCQCSDPGTFNKYELSVSLHPGDQLLLFPPKERSDR